MISYFGSYDKYRPHRNEDHFGISLSHIQESFPLCLDLSKIQSQEENEETLSTTFSTNSNSNLKDKN